GFLELQVFALFILARIKQAQGDFDAAFTLTKQIRHIGNAYPMWLVPFVPSMEVQIELAKGDLTSALKWLQRPSEDQPVDVYKFVPLVFAYVHEYTRIVTIQVLLAQARGI